MTNRLTTPRPIIGWREWAILESLSPTPTKAKIDTGARTSSLHAFDLRIHKSGGQATASFVVHPVQRSAAEAQRVEVPVTGFRDVRSSSGHSERRPVIRTPITLGDQTFDIDITLTSRDEMGFRMLLGRAAIRRRFLVDSGRSFTLGAKP
ncbi:MAG: hypothetical protein ACI9C1_003112 [Candidatus Aldehydirespiratoraceae bacterium]|jgi:hypothetical protein